MLAIPRHYLISWVAAVVRQRLRLTLLPRDLPASRYNNTDDGPGDGKEGEVPRTFVTFVRGEIEEGNRLFDVSGSQAVLTRSGNR